MTDLAKASGASTDFEVNGTTLQLNPLRFRDWGKLENWMRSSVISAARLSVADLPDDEAMPTIRSATLVSTKINIMQIFQKTQSRDQENKSLDLLQTFEGMLRTVQVSVRKSQELSLDALEDIFEGDIALLAEAFGEIMSLSFPNTGEETKAKNAETATTTVEPHAQTK